MFLVFAVLGFSCFRVYYVSCVSRVSRFFFVFLVFAVFTVLFVFELLPVVDQSNYSFERSHACHIYQSGETFEKVPRDGSNLYEHHIGKALHSTAKL